MSKSGRYSADRKKIGALDCFGTATAAISIDVAQCGTIFVCTPAGNDGNEGATITLPAVADAGEGWWCKFVLNAAIVSDGDDVNDIMIQNASGDTNDMIVHLPADSGADGAGHADGASVKFVENAAAAGDEVEVICTGSRWLVHARAAVSGGITKQ